MYIYIYIYIHTHMYITQLRHHLELDARVPALHSRFETARSCLEPATISQQLQSASQHIYIYIHLLVLLLLCVYTHVYIYIYIYYIYICIYLSLYSITSRLRARGSTHVRPLREGRSAPVSFHSLHVLQDAIGYDMIRHDHIHYAALHKLKVRTTICI